MHAKSTGEFISFEFSDRSVRSLVSAKRSANRWVQTKKRRLYFLADLWSQSEFRTQRKSQRKIDPKRELTQCTISDFDRLLDPQSWSFYVLAPRTSSCANLHQNQLIRYQNIVFTVKFGNRRTNRRTDERTDGQVKNTVPPNTTPFGRSMYGLPL